MVDKGVEEGDIGALFAGEIKFVGTELLVMPRGVEFENQIGPAPQGPRVGVDFGPGSLVSGVVMPGTETGPGLHDNLAPGFRQLATITGYEGDSCLAGLDFFGNRQLHATLSSTISAPYRQFRAWKRRLGGLHRFSGLLIETLGAGAQRPSTRRPLIPIARARARTPGKCKTGMGGGGDMSQPA